MASGSEDTPPDSSRLGSLSGTLVVVLVALGLIGYWWAQRSEPLHVIVVSLDTTRPDHLSAYGSARDTSPTLARLAAEGALFTEARTTAPWTLPAHMSLFTGLPPELHGVRYDHHVLPRDRRTLGEVFSEAGFRTVGLFTGPYVHGDFGFDRGMDTYESMTRSPMLNDRLRVGLSTKQKQELVSESEFQSHREVTSTRVMDRMPYFLERLPADRDFFFLHFFDPHYDYLPPRPHRQAFVDPGYRGAITGQSIMSGPWVLEETLPPADLKQLKDLYDAEIHYTDAQLGRLVNMLERNDLARNTILVVLSDHGEAFFEDSAFGARFGHRANLGDQVLRVPMIVWAPGRVPPGQRIDTPVSLIDVMPTLLELADLAPEPSLFGQSLVPLMNGEAAEERSVGALLDFVAPKAEDHYDRHSALIRESLKYVRIEELPWSPVNSGFDKPPLPGREQEFLFDLEADPEELVNLIQAAGDDPRVAFMRKAYLSWREQLGEFAEDQGWEAARIGGDEELAALRAMGYIGGSPDPEPDSENELEGG